MAVLEARADPYIQILDAVARAMARRGVREGDNKGGATLRVTSEEHVQRVVQVYWTPFQAVIPDRSIGLHLEVAEPTVHWAEAYLSPTYRNWVFCFAERADGDIQLTQYRDLATPQEAITEFFNLAGWYVLTATDKSWSDVVYTVGDGVEWDDHLKALAGGEGMSQAIQESLKKSTIFWMRWAHDGRQYTMPVWFLYDNKTQKIYVLSGERQQDLPGADQMRECEVILRWKGKNARVAELPADVMPLSPHDDDWDAIADKVAEKRLNIPGLPEDTARRWRDECVILELSLRT